MEWGLVSLMEGVKGGLEEGKEKKRKANPKKKTRINSGIAVV